VQARTAKLINSPLTQRLNMPGLPANSNVKKIVGEAVLISKDMSDLTMPVTT